MNQRSHLGNESQEVFDSELSREIKQIDKSRQSAVLWAVAAVLIGFLGVIWWLYSGPEEWLQNGVWAFGLIAVYLGFQSSSKYAAFRSDFKKKVVKQLVSQVLPGFTYDATSGISPERYSESEIFKQSFSRYHAEDYCSGKVELTNVEFSEIHTEYETTTRDSKGLTQTHYHTIFRGIFVHADFHKNFQGRTFVLPDIAESSLGSWFGGIVQNVSSFMEGRGERVALENVEFEKCFVVFSDSQQEARYLLTPKMQENILNLQKRVSIRLAMSFVRGRVFIAISESRNHFEPRFFSAVGQSDILEYAATLILIMDLVKELELNTRLWSKN